jgi:hypothetical protein
MPAVRNQNVQEALGTVLEQTSTDLRPIALSSASPLSCNHAN